MSGSALDQVLTAAAIDRGSRTPPYRQIARVLHDAVVTGALEAGVRLPAERELAERFGVGRATVARALRDLAATGLLERRVGHGTVVAFDLETWRSGPTGGIPWGAMLSAVAPATRKRRAVHSARGSEGEHPEPTVADRTADSRIAISSIEEGTRFLVDSLLRSGERLIVEGPPSSVLSVSLAMRGAEAIELAGRAGSFALDLERLLETRTGSKLIWLRANGALRDRGERAHVAGLTKRLGLPVIEEPPFGPDALGLLAHDPHDHVVRLDHRWINAPTELARLLRPLADVLGIGSPSDG